MVLITELTNFSRFFRIFSRVIKIAPFFPPPFYTVGTFFVALGMFCLSWYHLYSFFDTFLPFILYFLYLLYFLRLFCDFLRQKDAINNARTASFTTHTHTQVKQKVNQSYWIRGEFIWSVFSKVFICINFIEPLATLCERTQAKGSKYFANIVINQIPN